MGRERLERAADESSFGIFYMLDRQRIVPTRDIHAWSDWNVRGKRFGRHVAHTLVGARGEVPGPGPSQMVLVWRVRHGGRKGRSARRRLLRFPVWVSTIFLGVDHNFRIFEGGEQRPILFETMVFGGPLDHEQQRYCTWEEAEVGHALVVLRCRRLLALRIREIPE